MDEQKSPEETSIEAGNPNVTNPYPQKNKLKHSGLGIASFSLAIVAIIMSLVLTVIVFGTLINFIGDQAFDPANQQLMNEELMRMLDENPILLIAFPLFLVAGLIFLIGAVLGLIGLFQDDRRKIFAGIGTTLNVVPILLLILILILGFILG